MFPAAVWVLGLLAGCQAAAPVKDTSPERVPEPQPLPAVDVSPEEYLRRYAGEWIPEIRNVSDAGEWQTVRGAFMKKYAAEYRSYVFNWQQQSKVLAAAPRDPSKCSVLTCLKEWHDALLGLIKEFVPEALQPLAEASLNRVYMQLRKKIEAEVQRANSSHTEEGAKRPNSSHTEAGANSSHTESGADSSHDRMGAVEMVANAEPLGMSPAWYINRYAGDWVPTAQNVSDGQGWWKNFVNERAAQYRSYAEDSTRLAKEFGDAPALAGDCHTLAELKKWRDARLASIHAFVPKAFQGFATKAVDDEFERNKARIAKEEAAKAAQSTNASNSSAHSAKEEDTKAAHRTNASNASARAAEDEDAKAAQSENASHTLVTLMALTELAQNLEPASYMDDYADQWIPHASSNESQSPTWYINHYAGGYAGDYAPAVRNATDRDEWQQHFVGRYAKAYQHYATVSEHIQSKFANASENASDCHTLEALQQWREAQRARIGAFVPKMWQRMASDSVDREFEANKARIAQESASNATASEPVQFAALAGNAQPAGWMDQYAKRWIPHPMNASAERYVNRYAGESVPEVHNASDGRQWRRDFLSRYAEAFKQYASDSERLSKEYADAPKRARDARSMKELEAWKGAQLARIHSFVAPAFQRLAEDSVEQAFRKHRAQLQQEAASPQNSTQAADNATSLAVEGDAGSSAAGAWALVLLTLAAALTLALAARMARRRADWGETADVYVMV